MRFSWIRSAGALARRFNSPRAGALALLAGFLLAIAPQIASAAGRSTSATVSCVPAVRAVGQATVCTVTVTDTAAGSAERADRLGQL